MDRNLRLLGLGVGIRMFGNALYFPFLALFLVTVLHVGYLEIGLIFVGVGLVQLPFNMLGGLLTDRLGRRRLIVLGLAVEAAATAALGYAFAVQSLAEAIVAATLGGIVTTATGPASSAYIADLAEGAERTRGFTYYRIGFNAGYSAGVTLGGLLISLVGFAGSVAVASLVIAAGTVFLGLSLDPSPRDRQIVRSANRGEATSGRSSSPPSRTLRQSLGLLAKDRVALELLVAVTLAALIVGQWAVTFQLYVHFVLGIPYTVLGVGLALNGLVVVFGQAPTTEAMIGRRHTTIAILGVALYIVGFLGLGAAGLFAFFPMAVFFVIVVVLTIGENLVTIPASTLPSNLAPAGETGAYNGAFAMVVEAGTIASVLVGGLVLSLTTNPVLIWALLVVPAVPSILLFRHAAGRLARTVDRA